MTDSAKGVQGWLDALDAAINATWQPSIAERLRQVRQEIERQAEAIDRANDVPDPNNLDDFIGWAEAGKHRFWGLAQAFDHLHDLAQRLERMAAQDQARARARDVAWRSVEEMLALARARAVQECYEAATAYERAAAWLKTYSEQA